MRLKNYLSLLVDEEIDEKTDCPICIAGVSQIIEEICADIKNNVEKGTFQAFLSEHSVNGIYGWKTNRYPIPINRLYNLMFLWQWKCNKTLIDYSKISKRIFEDASSLKAKCSPVNIKIAKRMNKDLAYLLGVLYADGSLRNIWLTDSNESRFRWEITITEERKENLEPVVALLDKIFGIKTNVKAVYGGRWYRILFQSMILHRILHKLFEMPMGYKKGKLRIPKLIKKAPLEIKKQFVIGFFDGDGMCSRYNPTKKFTKVLSVSQSDKEILEDISQILDETGLNFRLTKSKRDKYVWYRLGTKSTKQITKFQELFGFRYENKKKRLKKLVNNFH